MSERDWSVIDYVAEEVTRQGHDIHSLDGIERVGWMLDAWSYALARAQAKPTMWDAVMLGQRVERVKNANGLRTGNVRVGSRMCPDWQAVPALLEELFKKVDTLTPLEFYLGYEEVHPFWDGNGRSGKVLFSWLAGKLLTPVFPPNDLFGGWIRNP